MPATEKKEQDRDAVRIVLCDGALDNESIEGFAAHPDNGAQCVFRGVVRRDRDLSPVKALTYDSYREMASRQLEQLTRTGLERWPGARISIGHRLGTVPLGEASVIVAVGTPHRAEAFDCCRYLIEELKRSVPIWKKERSFSRNARMRKGSK